MGNPVVHFEIVGADAPALHAFYSALFGWKLQTDNPLQYATIEREDNLNGDGVGIGGGVGPLHGSGTGYVTVYVEVPDVEAAMVKAKSLGGTRLFGPDQVPGVGITLGQFTDPEGHVIGLLQARG
jgi:uncharacterized protein